LILAIDKPRADPWKIISSTLQQSAPKAIVYFNGSRLQFFNFSVQGWKCLFDTV
jgi:hypothetical protein